MKTHWFPLRRPAIRALFLGGGSFGGGGVTLDFHDFFKKNIQFFKEEISSSENLVIPTPSSFILMFSKGL